VPRNRRGIRVKPEYYWEPGGRVTLLGGHREAMMIRRAAAGDADVIRGVLDAAFDRSGAAARERVEARLVDGRGVGLARILAVPGQDRMS
jgi:hypothetical protein